MSHFEHISLIGLTFSSQFVDEMAAVNNFRYIKVMLGVDVIHR